MGTDIPATGKPNTLLLNCMRYFDSQGMGIGEKNLIVLYILISL